MLLEKNNNIRIKICALGGLDENGKNCLLIEVDDDIFVVEAGLKYPDNFTPGVDYLIPNFDYLKENQKMVKGIIITHGHDDIYGSLPYLLSTVDCPCYLTKSTLVLIQSDFGSMMDKHKNRFITVEPSSEITIANHKLSLFSTTHSSADSFGFALRTPLGNIVYTGDYITDYNGLPHYSFDFSKVSSIANEQNTLLLMTESGAADKPGICTPNHRLTEHIRSLIEEQEKRIFISVYSQNFYNIQEIIDLVIANDKKLVIVNNRMLDALQAINANGNLVIPKKNLIQADEMIRYSSKDIIVLITGSGEELFELITSLANNDYPDKNVCLTPNDYLIMACPSVPGTETIATEAIDAVYQQGTEVKNLTRRDISSMHPHQEDIKMMLSLFRPTYYLPVKGEYRLLMSNAKVALATGLGYNYHNVILLDNGMVLGIDDNKKINMSLPRIKEGSLMVAGHNVGEVRESTLNERQRLADNGIVVISLAVNKDNRLISQPDVKMRGVLYLKDEYIVQSEINSIVSETSRELIAKKNMTTLEAEKKISDHLSKFFRKTLNKDPFIVTTIIDYGKPKEDNKNNPE